MNRDEKLIALTNTTNCEWQQVYYFLSFLSDEKIDLLCRMYDIKKEDKDE